MIERESLRAHDRRAERPDEIVELVEPPVGVLAREPRADEARLVVPELDAGVRNADDQRRLAASDIEPVRILAAHGAASRTGRSSAPDRLDDRAVAREPRRRDNLRVKIAVVVEMGDVAAEARAQRLERPLERMGA